MGGTKSPDMPKYEEVGLTDAEKEAIRQKELRRLQGARGYSSMMNMGGKGLLDDASLRKTTLLGGGA